MQNAFRRWLGNPGPASPPLPTDHPTPAFVEARARISEIEAAGLNIYRRLGLPTARGHYTLSPRGRSWQLMSNDLSPEERWKFILEDHKPGWRIASLADLGATLSPDTNGPRASRLLTIAEALSASLDDAARIGDESRARDIATAIEAGAASVNVRHSRPGRPGQAD